MRRPGVSRFLGVVAVASSLSFTGRVQATPTTPPEFLYQLAQEYLVAGQDAEAIHELRKLLLLEPHHLQAQKQLAILEQKQRVLRDRAIEEALNRLGSATAEPVPLHIGAGQAREAAMRKALIDAGLSPDKLAPPPVPPLSGETPLEGGYGALDRLNEALSPLTISGEVRSTTGITRDDVILQEANGDLNERNFRVFSGPLRFNTFDPRVFNRLRLDIDTNPETAWQLHSNITVDPWSFVGKTDRLTVVGATPTDSVELELKWWSPTNTAINQIFLTLKNGDSLATPEIEVSEGRTVPTTVTSTFSNTFRIPSAEVDYTFQPIRWFWTGYQNDVTDFRIFPLALEGQALTSDDPLHLSNHHIYWEPSPWLDEWMPGRLNVGASPRDFTKGEWSDDLSFFTRDSDLVRLTALRGTSLQWQPVDNTSLQAALASPKTLWQEYERFNSVLGMARVKQELFDGRLNLGGVYTTRWGYNERRKDSTNNVYAVDLRLSPWEWLAWEGEGALSKTTQDITSAFKSDRQGWVWHNALTASWWEQRLTSRLFFTHMDAGFEPGLANYRNTRKDQFWGRHLHLKRRLRLLKEVTPSSAVTPSDLEAVRIGNGVDVGRDALGVRVSGSFLDERWQPLVDVRNVHQTNGKYVETVVRQENTVKPATWLTTKTLLLYHDLPRTIGGIDPFVVDGDTDRRFRNAAIVNGRNPSLWTYSLGAEVAPDDRLAVWGVWERTNDTTVATDNFPRGLLNNASFATFTEDGRVIRIDSPFLFGQGFFPQPPYPFFDIFRAGVYVAPWERLEFTVDWTRNEFEHAGQIDDNLNHVGFLAAWSPLKRLVLIGRYVVSWAIDVADENAGSGARFVSRHSLYGRLAWKLTDDSNLNIEFGEAALGPTPAVFSVDPFGEFYPTLDTEHLVRIVYSSKF